MTGTMYPPTRGCGLWAASVGPVVGSCGFWNQDEALSQGLSQLQCGCEVGTFHLCKARFKIVM